MNALDQMMDSLRVGRTDFTNVMARFNNSLNDGTQTTNNNSMQPLTATAWVLPNAVNQWRIISMQ
jgi:hypothetical protein